MKKTAIFVTLIISATNLVAEEVFSAYPDDVEKFIERRDSCDHFRGEPPYDEARRESLIKHMNELCNGTDAKLANLKNKYKTNKQIIKALSSYVEKIEP